MDYRIIRSKRKTISIEFDAEYGVVIRAPTNASQSEIKQLVKEKKKQIDLEFEKFMALKKGKHLSKETLAELIQEGERVFAERVAYYAQKIGVDYGKITVKYYRSRWGSCINPSGDLSFNVLLLLTPMEALDSVVVHELCHRKVSGHGKNFYAEILRVFPDYKKWKKWLDENTF